MDPAELLVDPLDLREAVVDPAAFAAASSRLLRSASSFAPNVAAFGVHPILQFGHEEG